MHLGRHVRWLFGKGYSRNDFEEIYAGSTKDAWAYENGEFARRRFQFVLEMLPESRVASALEVGCAEGHFTKELAGRVDQLLACDISKIAIERAQQFCKDVRNVRYATLDVRNGLPGGEFDLILFSDVLYYFSKKEALRVIDDSAKRLSPGGFLLLSNEWSPRYRSLFPPSKIVRMIERSNSWRTIAVRQLQDSRSHTVTGALFGRR